MTDRTKNAKTVLFALLIAAMIMPFSGMQLAIADEKPNNEKYALESIKSAMQKADFYITVESHILSFDKESAQTIMSDHEIKIIDDFVRMQNEYVEKVKNDPNTKQHFDSEIEEKFSDLKQQIKENKNQVTEVDHLSNWILPEAFAWTDVCGGSFDNPHPEYVKKTIRSVSSKNTAVSLVESWGYVSVAPYASDPREWFNFNSLDYGKEISAYNCNFGAFRDQIVLDYDGNWNFNKQIKEPNPSFLDYDPPVWWWVWYTGVWHLDAIGTPTSW